MELYSLKDIKAGTFGSVMGFVNRAVAQRSLAEAAAQPDSMLNKHGEDYQLYYIGEFDPQSGKIVCPETPDYVITASDFSATRKAAA